MTVWMYLFSLTLIFCTGWLQGEACDMPAANACGTAATTSMQAASIASSGDLKAICVAAKEASTTLESCIEPYLQECDQALLDQIKNNFKTSYSSYDVYCEPGCENFVQRSQAIAVCVQGNTVSSITNDTRQTCSQYQASVDCVFKEIGNCSFLESKYGPTYRQSVTSLNTLQECNIKVDGKVLGLENRTECGEPQSTYRMTECFNRSEAEYGQDMAPGPAGGFNLAALQVLVNAIEQVQKDPTKQAQFCQKVSHQGLVEGVECVENYKERCPSVALAMVPKQATDYYTSVCHPGCRDYSNRMIQAQFCLGQTGIVQLDADTIRQSIALNGTESEYCRKANASVQCLLPHVNGCPLTITMYHQLTSVPGSVLYVLREECKIEVDLKVEEIETTPQEQPQETTTTQKGSTSGGRRGESSFYLPIFMSLLLTTTYFLN